jgi:hypothetical protein
MKAWAENYHVYFHEHKLVQTIWKDVLGHPFSKYKHTLGENNDPGSETESTSKVT